MSEPDSLYRFLFEHTRVRGELVQLETPWQSMLEHVDYPPPVRDLLGQAMAAATLMAATVKFDGSLILQLQGSGPVNMVLIQVTARRTVRGLARWHGEVEAGDLRSLCGEGYVFITIDPGKGRERYQGVVSLTESTLAGSLENYFNQSEQLPTRLWLAAGEKQVAGLLLQRLPAGEERDRDSWSRLQKLADTITPGEQLYLPPEEQLRRLFHDEELRLFEPERISFFCDCSRERIETALKGLGEKEVREMIEEKGVIEVDCEFCNRHYRFDAVDVEGLFADSTAPGSGKVH
jgi:molecular chaperone Hsp33